MPGQGTALGAGHRRRCPLRGVLKAGNDKKRPHPLPDRREGMGLFHFLDQLGQQLQLAAAEPPQGAG